MNVEELVKAVQNLTDEELGQFLDKLGIDEKEMPAVQDAPEKEKSAEDEPGETKTTDEAQLEETSNAAEEENPAEQPTESETAPKEEPTKDIPETDGNPGDVDEKTDPAQIPPMIKEEPVAEAPAPEVPAELESITEAPVLSDDGKEIPVDNDGIIAGLQSRITALESENKILRDKANKVDAAFGYTAKPTAPVKMGNGLIDPAYKNIKMHR